MEVGSGVPGYRSRLQPVGRESLCSPPGNLLTLESSQLETKTEEMQVTYLSNIIGSEGIQVDPKKVEAVTNWPVPSTVRSFLGFCNHYRRFVRDFAGIASPLPSLTKKKVPFVWTDECQAAFERLKRELITAPVLEFPDYNGKFIVDTDASNFSLGAVLSNIIQGEERPPSLRQPRSLKNRDQLFNEKA